MRYNKLLLSVISGVLMAVSWPYAGSVTPLIFVAIVPLLLVEEELFQENKHGLWVIVKYVYPAFFFFNLFTTWWIYNVQESIATKLMSAGPAIVLNATFMAIAFGLFHITRMRIGNKEGYIGLIIYWVAWEHLHLNWELSWPWLTFGNIFSDHPDWVQWYEYTGVLGGSLWILLINLGVFFLFKQFINERFNWKRAVGFAIVGFVPLFIWSFILKQKKEPVDKHIEVVLVQPNIDPYNEKFEYGKAKEQLLNMLDLAREKLSPETKLILFPETALQERATLSMNGNQLVLVGLWENNIEASMSVKVIREFLEDYPDLSMVIGLSSDRLQGKDEKIIPASRYIKSLGVYYQAYNAALFIAKDKAVKFYHKSELVPAVEFMPLEWLLKPLASLSLDFGGTTGTLGTQENQDPFFFSDDSIGVSPSICYESIYGHSSSEFVQNGASILGIITNDGWWGDSPGYKQHLSLARLRAIETRRWVARAANTGISAFINPKGEIVQRSNWWVPAVLKQEVTINNRMTFYVTYGAYIGRTAAFMAVLLLIYTMMRYIKRNKIGI